MANIRIVTDSTADVPRELLEHYQIRMVPLKVHFGDQMYLDGVTIEPAQFYERLVAADALPTTSQPSPNDFNSIYTELLSEPDTVIISIHLSSAMSGTYQSAMLAKSMIEDATPDAAGRIHVVDSRSASYGFGQMAVMAAQLARDGVSVQAILERIEQFKQDRKLYFLVDTLEFLHKGGRIGRASAMFGALLNIKPILSINPEGEVYAVDKARGTKKVISRVVELFRKDLEGVSTIHIAAGYATNREVMDGVIEQLREHFEVASVEYTMIGSVIGTHVGPGVVAMFVTPVR